MSDEIKKDEQVPDVKTEPSSESLSESELDQVAGGAAGKVTFNPFSITKHVDKASPVLFL